MEKQEKYPLDTEKLIKGSIVSVTECEAALGEVYGTNQYSLALMGLVSFIYQEMFSRGLVITVRTVRGAIHVLEDNAASEHNDKAIKNAIRGIKQKTGRLLAVDSNNLTPAEKTKHDRRCVINSKILQAISNTRKRFKIKPTTRKTPALNVGR